MSLSVRESGPVDAPAILFLHGLGLSGAMWQPQFERLADFYHCLAPDLPECGNSAAIGPFRLKDAAGRVASVIRERVPGGSAHVVGLSLGGAVALQMLRDEPQVVDHPARSAGRPESSPRLLTPCAGLMSGSYICSATIGWPSSSCSRITSRKRIANSSWPTCARSSRVTLHCIWELTKLRLPRNDGQVPILIVAGQKEAFVTQQAAYTMSRAVPFARGALVPGAGHFWNLEAPDVFTQTVRAWIEDEALPSRLVRV